jgi:hypothetical protein
MTDQGILDRICALVGDDGTISTRATTGRYLHARPALEQAAAFTRAFEPALGEPGSATTSGAVASPAFELSRGVGLGQRRATN